MSKSIPTVRRAKWHRKGDKWQVQNAGGELFSCGGFAPKPIYGGFWRFSGRLPVFPWKFGPKSKAPKDHSKTMRRIIDAPKDKRVANKKRKA